MAKWLHSTKRVLIQPGRLFFIYLLILNGLLFLPLYLLNWEDATLLPFVTIGSDGWRGLWQQLLVGRENFDPFRLNLELSLLIILLINIGWLRRAALRPLFVLLYFLLLSYYTYEAITLSIYQSEPVFYNHYFLALDGLSYLFEHLNIASSVYIVALFGVAALVWAISRLASLCYQSTLEVNWSPLTRATFAALGLLLTFAVVREQQALAAPTTVLSSLSYKVEANIEKSLALYHTVSSFDDTKLDDVYDYSAYTLSHKPNIYLLFVESYGSVLYKRPDYRIDYSVLLKQLKRALDEGGWHSTSALSVAPTWGGGSWLSFTSTQFGLRIDNHPYYLTLLDKYQHERYPHLGSFLQDQGYKTYRLSAIVDKLSEDSWQRYERMYNVDGWFRFKDLDYSGPLYGWGPAVPDQYSLNYAREQIIEQNGTEQPFMLFFITQASHYPFAPIPKLAPNWQTLNQSADEATEIDDEAREHSVRRQDYFNAIAYDLNMLVQFILQNSDEDALYILIGDHQPPRVSRRADGFDTPIHIISRNPSLITAFQNNGFTPGLWINDTEPTMKHEGLYSLIVRALLSDGNRQADSASDLPPYLPDGYVEANAVANRE